MELIDDFSSIKGAPCTSKHCLGRQQKQTGDGGSLTLGANCWNWIFPNGDSSFPFNAQPFVWRLQQPFHLPTVDGRLHTSMLVLTHNATQTLSSKPLNPLLDGFLLLPWPPILLYPGSVHVSSRQGSHGAAEGKNKLGNPLSITLSSGHSPPRESSFLPRTLLRTQTSPGLVTSKAPAFTVRSCFSCSLGFSYLPAISTQLSRSLTFAVSSLKTMVTNSHCLGVTDPTETLGHSIRFSTWY